jgi:hypothetical protein
MYRYVQNFQFFALQVPEKRLKLLQKHTLICDSFPQHSGLVQQITAKRRLIAAAESNRYIFIGHKKYEP